MSLNDQTVNGLFQAMRQIEAGADRGAAVGARQLLLATGWTAEELVYCLEVAAKRGQLSLHMHDWNDRAEAEGAVKLTRKGHDNREQWVVCFAIRNK